MRKAVTVTGRRVLECAVVVSCLCHMAAVSQAQTRQQPPATAKARQDAQRISTLLLRHLGEGTSDPLPSLKGREDVLAELWRTYPEQSVELRRLILGYIPLMGTDPRSACGRRWIRSTRAVKALVGVLVKDTDRTCRATAARILVQYTPDAMVRAQTSEIVATARRYAGPAVQKVDENLILLLGSTGSSEAKQLLEKWGAADSSRIASPLSSINVALAKLGDTKREREVIDAFEKACSPAKRSRGAVRAAVRHAKVLGYIGQPGSVMALARQYRNPLHYRAEGSDYLHVMSLRFAIVNALWRVWPDNEVLCFPYKEMPGGEDDYIKVEAWLESYLGVKWRMPRPPFTESGIAPEALGW